MTTENRELAFASWDATINDEPLFPESKSLIPLGYHAKAGLRSGLGAGRLGCADERFQEGSLRSLVSYNLPTAFMPLRTENRELRTSAFILAGGRSSRMGVDKAFLKFRKATLLERAVEIARSVADRVYVSGPRHKFGHDAIEDVFPDCGPLGGIHAVLTASQSDLNLILAVDLPFIEADFLRYLLRQASATISKDSPLAVVPRAAGGWQPLCAVYHKAFANEAEKALCARHYKIDPLFSQVPIRVVEEAEILQAGFSLQMFDNLNTPDELKLAEQKLA